MHIFLCTDAVLMGKKAKKFLMNHVFIMHPGSGMKKERAFQDIPSLSFQTFQVAWPMQILHNKTLKAREN